MKQTKWTQEEEAVIHNHWFNGSREYILSQITNRSWNAIVIHASKLKITRDQSSETVNCGKQKSYLGKSKLYKLLEETPIAYYWTGFILADGCVKNNKRLVISLSVKDYDHLCNFCSFINAKPPKKTKNGKYCVIAVQDNDIIAQFTKKFHITNRKTYSLSFPFAVTDDLFLSTLAGFIDGDGSIKTLSKRKDFQLGIVGHASSTEVFNRMLLRLNQIAKIKGSVKLDKKGYARLRVCNSLHLKILKQRIVSIGDLPIMSRKWNNIDMEYISRTELKIRRQKQYDDMKKNGFSVRYISKILGISKSAMRNYRSNNA